MAFSNCKLANLAIFMTAEGKYLLNIQFADVQHMDTEIELSRTDAERMAFTFGFNIICLEAEEQELLNHQREE
jgi:hypothetical protein